MSFLNIAFLTALPLIGVPVLLHFYQRRQRHVVFWGAMQFLTDAAIEGRRFERLEELLLMLLRAIAVAALVLAVAQPLVRSRWGGASPEQEVILLLDDSMSMGRTFDNESSLDRLQQRASELLTQLTEKDSVQVMLASGGGKWLTSGPVAANGRTKRELVAAVEDLRPSRGTADMFACLQWVVDANPSKEARARRVLVFTDCQAYGWHTDADGRWQRLRESCQAVGDKAQQSAPTFVEIIDCGLNESQIENLAIQRLDASRTLVGSGETVTVSTEIANMGDGPSKSATLQWTVEGDPIAESTVPILKAGESIQRSWSHEFAEQGVYSVGCQVTANDQLSLDDEEAVTIEVVDKIPFLIVEQRASGSSEFAAARLLTATLGYAGDVPRGDWQSVFAPRIIDHDQLKEESLAEYRAVVIVDLPTLSSDIVDRLRSFVERGGGLWVALGNRTDREEFNSIWFDEGDGLSPLKVAAPIGHGRAADAEIEIHPPSADHVVTRHIADTQRLDIDEVKISRHHQFVRAGDDSDVSVLLETSVGAPLVVENYLGQGHIIVQALPLGLQWTNMPLTKAYVVMVHDFLAYLTQPAATRYNLQPGGEIVYAAAEELVSATARLETPLGHAITLTPQDEGDAPLCRYAGTYLPGPYQLKFVHGDKLLRELPFHVSRDVEESNLDRLSAEQRNWLTDKGGIEFIERADVRATSTAELPSPRPVWWLLLVILLIVMAFELVIATQSARRRYAPVG